MCTLCGSTNINMIIEFVLHVSGDGFNGGSDSYLQFREEEGVDVLNSAVFNIFQIGLSLARTWRAFGMSGGGGGGGL